MSPYSAARPVFWRLPVPRLFTLFLLMCAMGAAPAAAGLEQQRSQFQEARQALRAGQLERFQQLASGLENYPLYPYLRYDHMRPRLHRVGDAAIAEFLERYPDFPHASSLRVEWLNMLARQGRWDAFLDRYTPQSNTRLRCLELQARINTGRTDGLLEATRELWLVGKSQPDECDPAFDRLYDSALMNDQLLWERIRLSMENNETGLANFLGRKLSQDQQPWVQRWIQVHNNPDTGTRNPGFSDTPVAREILTHGLQRLARLNVGRAIERWQALEDSYQFSPEQRNAIVRDLATQAARRRHDDAYALLDKVAAEAVDAEVFIYRLRNALNNHDWHRLVRWTEGEVPDDVERTQWQYWRARALEKTGQREQARALYQNLAAERDYYGFLAADRLGASYQMNHFPVAVSDEQYRNVLNMPAIQRALEWRALGEEYAARREWHNAFNHMTSLQLQIAARIAVENDWHHRAIFTLARARAFDDLVLRFPVLYSDLLDKYSTRNELDPAWVYALVRAESAFIEDVRSPAGALGLMQVMPRTGEMTARQLGMNNFNSNHLTQAEHNVPIGSKYLRMMYDDFNGNMILATAAYNAGPHRVRSWLPEAGCIEPDVWIENIPFLETRNYVKRVLSYISIYEWRLERGIRPLAQRMTAVLPRRQQTLIAGMSCTDAAVGMAQ